MLADAAGVLAAGVGEGLARFAFEIRDAGLVGFEIDHVADDQPEHDAFGEQAGAAEHAPDRDRAELREQIADELGVQAGMSLHVPQP